MRVAEVEMRCAFFKNLRKTERLGPACGFHGVAVITSALHAEGPGFKPQWNHFSSLALLSRDRIIYLEGSKLPRSIPLHPNLPRKMDVSVPPLLGLDIFASLENTLLAGSSITGAFFFFHPAASFLPKVTSSLHKTWERVLAIATFQIRKIGQ